MGDVVRKRLRTYGLWIGGLACLLFLIAIVAVYNRLNTEKIDVQKVRVDCNMLVYNLEKNLSQIDTPFAYCVVGLDGKILYSTIDRYKVNDRLNLHTFGSVKESDKEYRIPLVKEGTQYGYAIIEVNSKDYLLQNTPREVGIYSIISLLLFLILFLLYRMKCFIKQDILSPVEQIHNATNAIMQGNYEQQVLYDYDGEIGGLCHDFELMRAELKDYYEREKQYKKKETLLLASISHDLKTPLATVGNYVEGILYDVVDTKEEIKEYAEVIRNKVTYLNGLIDDILEHSKAGLNQFQIIKEDVYANEFFEKTLHILQQEAEKKSITLTYGIFPKIILTIDTKRITQVLYNLVDNAIKYSKPCGYIHITNKIEGSYLVVCVKDNGIGISAADLPYIFETFYRGDKARNQEIPGSGLGLNIARYIVKNHGGDMDCESTYGKGTTISFTIKI